MGQSDVKIHDLGSKDQSRSLPCRTHKSDQLIVYAADLRAFIDIMTIGSLAHFGHRLCS